MSSLTITYQLTCVPDTYYLTVVQSSNQLIDNILHQLGVDHIFSAPYYPQSNGKLYVFHKYLKPMLKKLCKNSPDNWDHYLNQVLASYNIIPHLATGEVPLSLLWKGSQFATASTAATYATFSW